MLLATSRIFSTKKLGTSKSPCKGLKECHPRCVCED